MTNSTLQLPDDRTIGFVDYGPAGGPMFAWGVEGYVDDRLVDGQGWVGFDMKSIRSPGIVPNAMLCLTENDGHFSIISQVPKTLADLIKAAE